MDWQIEQPQEIKEIKLTGYNAEGEVLSGPLHYDLSAGLPASLTPFCTQQRTRLTCNNLQTDARRPGKYTFELAVTPKDSRHGDPITQQTNAVTITPRPLPTITEFLSPVIRYREEDFPTTPPPAPKPDGILLNWRVNNIKNLQALRLVARTGEGELLGEIIYPIERDENGPKLPNSLPSVDVDSALPDPDGCELKADEMLCKHVPTYLKGVSTYQFELTAIPLENAGEIAASEAADQPALAPSKTELITVEARSPKITEFLLNGESARAKYVFEADTQTSLTLPLSWTVEGGSTMQVKLLPAPGPVPSSGGITFPLKPGAGTTTITLQADNGAGQSDERSIVIETYDPTPPVTPEEIAAAAASAAAEAATAAQAQADQAAADGADNEA
ncbi:MAG: hypothetical protein AAFN68_09400, partial [Pseudomonadota bacterium]